MQRVGSRGRMVAVVAGMCVGGSAGAATLTVAPTGAQYTSISAAMTAAQDGDIIRVSPGIYTDNLNYGGKRLTVESTAGRTQTTLRPLNTTEPLVRLSGGETGAVLQGFRLTGSSLAALSVSGNGAATVRACEFNGVGGAYGIHVTGGASLVVDDVEMRNGAPGVAVNLQGGTLLWSGGGIRGMRPSVQTLGIQSGTLEVLDARFEDNRVANGFGGVLSVAGGTARLRGVTMVANGATYGGAIYAGGGALVSVADSTLAFNSATQGGAVVAGGTARVFIRDSRLVENEADFGGGIQVSGATVQVLNSVLVGNQGRQQGSGVFLGADADLLFLHNVISDSVGPGGGVDVTGASVRVVAFHNVVPDVAESAHFPASQHNLRVAPLFTAYTPDTNLQNDNFAPAPGSPMKDAGLPLATDVDGSRADIGPGGLYDARRMTGGRHAVAENGDDLSSVVAAASTGDTIWVYPGIYRTTVNPAGKNVTIRGAYGSASVVIAGAGTAVVLNTGETSVALRGLTLWANAAGDAHALLLQNVGATLEDVQVRSLSGATVTAIRQTSSNVTARNVALVGNRSGAGWVVDGTSSLDLEGALFQDNDHPTVDGTLSLGTSGAVNVITARFINNRARVGGGIHAGGTGTVRIADAFFTGNRAGNGGAVNVAAMRTVAMEWVTLVGNHAGVSGGGLAVNGTALMSNVILMANNAGTSGGGAWVAAPASLRLVHGVVAENNSPAGSAVFSDGYAELVNTVVAHHATTTGAALQREAAASIVATYCALHENFRNLAPGTVDESNVLVDPLFVSHVVNGVLDDDLHLGMGSTLVNRGAPELMDADGTRSDIGLYGGAELPERDMDGDGWSVRAGDCDDEDPARNPAEAEVCNMVDDNCDGETDITQPGNTMACGVDGGVLPDAGTGEEDAGTATSSSSGAVSAGSSTMVVMSSSEQPGSTSSAGASSTGASSSSGGGMSAFSLSSSAMSATSAGTSAGTSLPGGSSASNATVSSSQGDPDDGDEPASRCSHAETGTPGLPWALLLLVLLPRRRARA